MSDNEKTESKELTLPSSSPEGQKRKRGGQPGNHNAHKYGIYSKFILLSDHTVIEGMTDGSLKDELALEWAEAATDKAEKLAWDAACHYWFESIVKIKTTAAEKAQQADEVWDTFMEAIQATNDRQGVK